MIQWMHPRIACLTYTIGSRCGVLKVCGWTRTLRRKDDVEEMRDAPESPAAGHAPEPLRRPPPQATQSEKRAEQAAAPGHGETISASRDEHEKQGVAPREKRMSGWQKIRTIYSILDRQHVPARAFRWCSRVVRLSFQIVRFDHLRLHAKAGIADPAETGKLYGWCNACAAGLFSRQKNTEVWFEPLFSSDALEVEGSMGLRTSIARAGFMAGIAFITFPYYTAYVVWRRVKKLQQKAAVA